MRSAASYVLLTIATLAFSRSSTVVSGFLVVQPLAARSITLRLSRPSSASLLLPSVLQQLTAAPKLRESSHLALSQEDNNDSSELSSPLDQPVLALLDTLSLLAFAAVGKASHTGANGAIDVGAVVTVAFPFLASWFATSPLTGVYNTKNGAFSTTLLKGWIVAMPLGCVLRGVIKGYVPPLPFVIVTMISTLVVLGGTRFIYSKVEEGEE
mmetsp:Transcript_29528/g.48725  ORF Transcript_29528/g.48725 Transcript_29528/m.48725 type:complete len:211 (-) Transcript_29528:33-665(-)|eukprot:CAMPEP_0119013022 /NCGR_PEP_ID=MMETSP1176-20130426/7753_1 /TAXON_ID=265551 /ORGANISM="Synedropsis recta cf, Strain CCMP1620" /LENGTH=210 /DNA_ID=CAMNT_0006966071 /DNA_START=38 /DNA_END=670 /DNA_ORIENTATION=+